MDNKQLSILMITDFYPPHLGGVEQVVADLSAELSAHSHEVRVATLWHEGLAHRERDGGVEVHRLQSTTRYLPFIHAQAARPFHPPIPDPLVTRQLKGLISWYQPDIVHGHTWMMCSALPLQRAFGFATVATLHDYALLCPKKTLIYRDGGTCRTHLSRYCMTCSASQYGMIKGTAISAGLAFGRGLYQDVDAFTAISTFVADQHRHDRFLQQSRLTVVPNFVRDDLLRLPAGPPLADLPKEYMLFVGALGEHKGVSVLLNAYLRLRTSIPLVLIGLPQADTPPLNHKNVIVRRGLSHGEVIRAMDHCRFLIAPSLWPEGFGMVAIEAMARGKAVVASATGGLTEVVKDGETGFLVTPGNEMELSEIMNRLLEDAVLAARLGRVGAARCAAAFSAEVVVEAMEQVYRGARRRARTGEG